MIRLSSEPGAEERHRLAQVPGEEFRKTYTRARILLPYTLAGKLDGINREFVAVSNCYLHSRVTGKGEYQALIAVYQSTEGNIKTTLADLESAFRDALAGKE